MDAITLPGELDSLPLIRTAVAQAAEAAGLNRKRTYRLCLAVDEIATNAIVHGYLEAHQTGDLRLWAEVEADVLKVFLEDSGPAYDPHQVQPPADLHAPVDERLIGGLGVYLTLKGVDQLVYERVGGYNRNIFIINRLEQN